MPNLSKRNEIIKTLWARDSCGGVRDSILKVLIAKNVLYGMNEDEVYYLLGKPYYIGIVDSEKHLVYRVIGSYNKYLKVCDPVVIKTLDVWINKSTSKVTSYSGTEE